MAYQFPNMGGVGPQFPQANYMPQINQPYYQGYPPGQPLGYPYMNQPPQMPGGSAPMVAGGPQPMSQGHSNRFLSHRQQMNPYGQGAVNAPFQGQAQPGFNGRRPGLVSRLAANQQNRTPGNSAGMQFPQAGMQFPQAGMQFPQPMQQQSRRGLNLGRGRQQGMAGGMPPVPQMPTMPQMPPMPGVQSPGMGQPMLQQQPMAQPNVSPMGKQIKPKQFNLSGIGGMSGNGIASIPDANNLSLVANNLPDPATFSPGNTYVAYLTNRKGQGAFALGPLMPIGGGTYRLNFNSNVPFYDYDQVVVSLENPLTLQNTPTGQVVLASQGGAGLSLPKPVRKFFGGMWQKVKGAGKGISNRIGGGKNPPQPQVPEINPNPQTMFNNYTLGPNISPMLNTSPELPGLGSPTEAPPVGENP